MRACAELGSVCAQRYACVTEYLLSKKNCSAPVIFSIETALEEGKNERDASQQRQSQIPKSPEIALDTAGRGLTGSEVLALVR